MPVPNKIFKIISYLTTTALLLPIFLNGQVDTINLGKENNGIWVTSEAVPQAVVQSTRAFREKLLSDPYRPNYHFCLPEDVGYPGDPNGAFFHDGRYHLMYLYNRTGSGFCWGHISSSDLLHWRHHPDALKPGNGDEGAFSGGAFVDDDGTCILSYWMLHGSKGIGLARSSDNSFHSWEKMHENPVIKSTEWGITELKDPYGKIIPVGSSDPSNIWKKDGKYYMLTGNLLVLRKYGSRGSGLVGNKDQPALPKDSLNYQGDWLDLFVSEDLKKWTYMHRFYESDRTWTRKTEDNMCPSFLPLPTNPNGGEPSGKHLLLFISHNLGCQYYIGDYVGDKFVPQNHGRMTWKDNAYFAPEALVDDHGRQIMWAWIFDDRPDSTKKAMGWTGTYGLPRTLWLGPDGTLRMRPVKELEQLRFDKKIKSNITVNAGNDLSLNGFGHESMELEIIISPNDADRFGLKMGVSKNGEEETLIYYDSKEKMLKIDTRKSSLSYGRKTLEEAPLTLQEQEPLRLNIFMDKSIVEVYANDKQAIARRIYPTLKGTGIFLFSEGAPIHIRTVNAWRMAPTNPY